MPDGSIKVTYPNGRFVYIDGNYDELDPPAITCVVLVEYGPTTLETLDDQRRVDYRGQAVTSASKPNAKIKLKPVIPPEPIGGKP